MLEFSKKLPFSVVPNVINDTGKGHQWMLRTGVEGCRGIPSVTEVCYRSYANYKEENKPLQWSGMVITP